MVVYTGRVYGVEDDAGISDGTFTAMVLDRAESRLPRSMGKQNMNGCNWKYAICVAATIITTAEIPPACIAFYLFVCLFILR